MANMTCPNCDRTISRIATVCPFCGYSLKQDPESRFQNYYHEDQTFPSDDKEFLFPDKQTPPKEPVRQPEEDRTRVTPQETNPQRKNPRQPRSGYPGRCFIGYRSGHFLNRWISMIYHLSAVLLLIWAFQLTPEFNQRGLAMMHLARTFLGGLILFLPAILLSNTAIRRSIPLIRSRSTAKVVFGTLLFLVPLVLLFSYCCILCR